MRANLGLVRRAVSDMASRMPRHVSRDDLLSAGMIGLAQAARSFDESRGVPFHRYAATRIKGAILDELRAHDWASRPVRAKARRMDAAVEELTAALGRRPTSDEIASALGIDRDAVVGLTGDVQRATVLSYEAIVPDGDAESLLLPGELDPEGELIDRERNAYLVDAVRSLPERLQRVVVAYFFEDRSMQSIGEELGVTESRVSQLRAEALDLLRDGLNTHLEPSLVAPPPRPNGRVARRKAAYFSAIAAASTPRERIGREPRLTA